MRKRGEVERGDGKAEMEKGEDERKSGTGMKAIKKH